MKPVYHLLLFIYRYGAMFINKSPVYHIGDLTLRNSSPDHAVISAAINSGANKAVPAINISNHVANVL